MTSLRRRLTLSLWFALSAVGLLIASLTYVLTLQETDRLLDYQMQEIARFLGAQSFTVPGPAVIFPGIDFNHDADDDILVTVRDASGKVVYASRAGAPLPAQAWRGFRTEIMGGITYRLFSAESQTLQVVVAQQMDTRRETAAIAAFTALLPIGLSLPLLGIIIGLVIRQQLKPLRTTALEVSKRPGLMFAPLPVADMPTEVRPLIDEINRLLARLQHAIQHEQRFIADAAHSLRTPLTALQLQADVLNGSGDATENAIRLIDLRAGIRRAVRLSDHLLALAVNESGSGPVRGHIDLDLAITESRELYQATAEARGVRLLFSADSHAVVPGDARYLALLAGNLLDNALRYTAAGGEVSITTRVDGAQAVMEVIDDGPGLPEAELDKVFDRFHRAPDDTTEGSGLGLAVVRGVVERLGGKISLENRRDRDGLIARVCLPCLTFPVRQRRVLVSP